MNQTQQSVFSEHGRLRFLCPIEHKKVQYHCDGDAQRHTQTREACIETRNDGEGMEGEENTQTPFLVYTLHSPDRRLARAVDCSIRVTQSLPRLSRVFECVPVFS